MASHPKLAGEARAIANDQDGKMYRALSCKMCWEAVCHLLHETHHLWPHQKSGIPRKPAEQQIRTWVSQSNRFAENAGQLAAVPAGAVLLFIETISGAELAVHCMLSLGQGYAAGNKNNCIGMGNPGGWEVLNLNGLRWDLIKKAFDAPAGNSTPKPMTRRDLKIRFREI
jgi:hypothetical protein